MKLETAITALAASQGIPLDKFLQAKALLDMCGDPIVALHSDAFIAELRKLFPLSIKESDLKQIERR